MSEFFLPEYMPLLFKAVELNGAKALKHDAIVTDEGHLVVDLANRNKLTTSAIGWWYNIQKLSILNVMPQNPPHTKAALLTMMLLPWLKGPKTGIPHELWDMVALEYFYPFSQIPLFVLLTQNGTNEVVVADLLETFFKHF